LSFKVKLDDLAAASRHRFQVLPAADPVKGDDFGAHVGQHHCRQRAGADAGDSTMRVPASGPEALTWDCEADLSSTILFHR